MKPSEVIPADSFRHSYDAANVKHKPRCVKVGIWLWVICGFECFLVKNLHLSLDISEYSIPTIHDNLTRLSTSSVTYLPSATGHFWWWQLKPGTVCHQRQEPPTHCCSFGERQKHICSDCHSLTDRKPLQRFTNCCSLTLQRSTHVLYKLYKVPLQRP